MADIFSVGHAMAHQRSYRTDVPVRPLIPATDGQIGYLATLLAERDWHAEGLSAKYVSRSAVLRTAIDWALNDDNPLYTPPEARRAMLDADALGDRVNAVLKYLREAPNDLVHNEDDAYIWRAFSKSDASKLVEWLLTLTPRTVAVSDDDVPAGRYALDTNDGAHNDVAFYKVDRPTEGKWAGYVFVKLMISDDEQRLNRAAAQGVLRRIAEIGAEECSARYGHLIGECGICGRTLTNDESRERGIGPVCAAKAGW